MQRTTIMLPPELKHRATKYCEQKGISLGQLIREALDKEVSRVEIEEHSADPFFSDKAVYHGDVPTDLSLDHDKYLYQDRK